MRGARLWTAVFAIGWVLALNGCGGAGGATGGGGGGGSTSGGTVLRSDRPRELNPSVPAADLTALVDGNTTFALNLYGTQRDGAGNLFYSPYSLSLALAMTLAGAREQTATQTATALQLSLTQERLNSAFNALDLSLQGTAATREATDFTLSVVNQMWGQQDYPFQSSYLDVLAVNYGAGLRLVDFTNATEAARQTINAWVAEKTANRITELLPPRIVTADTRFVLSNAVYFLGKWLTPFPAEATSAAAFHLADGTTVNTPTMSVCGQFAYAQGSGYQAISLPYRSSNYAMLMLVPDAGTWTRFEQNLSRNVLTEAVNGLSSRQVALALPKFSFTQALNLADALKALGMVDAFSTDADFSGMDGTRQLSLSAVVHKAFVAVDEAGTEAAAATGVIGGVTAAPADPVALTIDRPFWFCIRHEPTGTLLFCGRVLDPRS